MAATCLDNHILMVIDSNLSSFRAGSGHSISLGWDKQQEFVQDHSWANSGEKKKDYTFFFLSEKEWSETERTVSLRCKPPRPGSVTNKCAIKHICTSLRSGKLAHGCVPFSLHQSQHQVGHMDLGRVGVEWRGNSAFLNANQYHALRIVMDLAWNAAVGN